MAASNRQQLLAQLLMQARNNGFEFKKWYKTTLESQWIDFDAAVANLARGRRYYSLVFSHAFASFFWKPGSQLTFIVPGCSWIRRDKSGKLTQVNRKAFTRRTLKADSWQWHLREMAGYEDPLDYLRRFLLLESEVERFRAEPPHDLTALPTHEGAAQPLVARKPPERLPEVARKERWREVPQARCLCVLRIRVLEPRQGELVVGIQGTR